VQQRIRTIKPEFFRHEEMYELELKTNLPLRLAFVGLLTCCDREGRFNWRPRALKAMILPYDDVDFSRVLDAWGTRGFVVQYRVADEVFGYVPTFKKHQVINNRESLSVLPKPPENQHVDAWGTREAREGDASGTRPVQKGTEQKGTEQNRTQEALGVISDQTEEEFEQFWQEYPRHEDRKKAKAAWHRLSHADQVAARAGVVAREGCEQWQDKMHIPHATTYLNGRRWEDEIPQGGRNGTNRSAAAVPRPMGKEYPKPKRFEV
jgi:hypothetical protein